MALDLRNCDCMELMAEYPDKYFDLAIVDPPYGIGWDGQVDSMVKEGTMSKDNWKRKSKGYKRKEWDVKPPAEYFIELFRVSKKQIIWGGNHFDLGPSKGFIFWDKDTGDFSLGDGELAWTNVTGAVRKYFYPWAGFRKGPNGNVREDRIHPTQKPIALYKWLLTNYAKKGDKILDTHLGSMPIAIACHDYNFDLTGCELDKEYFDAGMKRVSNHVSQLSLLH